MGRTAKLTFASIVFTLALIAAEYTHAEKTPEFEQILKQYKQTYDFIAFTDTIYTFESEFIFPNGYARPDSTQLTPYAHWVAHFPIWYGSKSVGSWKRSKKYNYDEIARAVHLPWNLSHTFKDCSIPLRMLAEYLRLRGMQDSLIVTPPVGDDLSYSRWLTGTPIYGPRGDVMFRDAETRKPNDTEYFAYLDFAMYNTDYRSLSENCVPVSQDSLLPGDMLIGYDGPGKKGVTYVILNIISNPSGDKLYTVATGCPDACDFHIPKLNEDRDFPWIDIQRLNGLGAEFETAGYFRFRQIR